MKRVDDADHCAEQTDKRVEAMVASQVMRRSRAVIASLAAVCAERSSGFRLRGGPEPPVCRL
jgi:hypothetical protein